MKNRKLNLWFSPAAFDHLRNDRQTLALDERIVWRNIAIQPACVLKIGERLMVVLNKSLVPNCTESSELALLTSRIHSAIAYEHFEQCVCPKNLRLYISHDGAQLEIDTELRSTLRLIKRHIKRYRPTETITAESLAQALLDDRPIRQSLRLHFSFSKLENHDVV